MTRHVLIQPKIHQTVNNETCDFCIFAYLYSVVAFLNNQTMSDYFLTSVNVITTSSNGMMENSRENLLTVLVQVKECGR